MGIRFICQHCRNRLNVKSNQAGQSGECPHCGGSITVPAESTLAVPESLRVPQTTNDGSVFDVDNQITEAGMSPSIRLETESTSSGFSVPEATPQRVLQTFRRSSATDDAEPFLLDKPQLPSTLGKIDPIDEAPNKVWYYRSRELGEKGPIKAKQMQAELDEGNVTIGCIVWREDWEDWQAAERVFPTLVALFEANLANRAIRSTNGTFPDELNPHSMFQRRRRKLQVLGVAAIAGGLLIVGLLVYYLSQLVSK